MTFSFPIFPQNQILILFLLNLKVRASNRSSFCYQARLHSGCFKFPLHSVITVALNCYFIINTTLATNKQSQKSNKQRKRCSQKIWLYMWKNARTEQNNHNMSERTCVPKHPGRSLLKISRVSFYNIEWLCEKKPSQKNSSRSLPNCGENWRKIDWKLDYKWVDIFWNWGHILSNWNDRFLQWRQLATFGPKNKYFLSKLKCFMKEDFSHKRSLLVRLSPRFWQNEPQESSSNKPTLCSENISPRKPWHTENGFIHFHWTQIHTSSPTLAEKTAPQSPSQTN